MKILKYIRDPYKIFDRISDYYNFPFMNDASYLKLKFRGRMGYKLNLKNPQSFNEKLQWIKLYDKRPIYTKLVDKYTVKDYVASKIDKKYLIPTLEVYDYFDQIDFEKLPTKFVLKCNHDSGGLVICKDKDSLDINMAKEKLSTCLKRNFFYYGREWPYKNVDRKIIAEKYIDLDNNDSAEYKFFCFDGEPRFVCLCKGVAHTANSRTNDFLDIDFNKIPLKVMNPNSNQINHKPKEWDEMIEIAKTLSKGIPHVRVDLYLCAGKVYFGELTFFHNSGLRPFEPLEWDYKFGEYFNLPASNKQQK